MSEFFNYRLTTYDMNILGIPKPIFPEVYARLPADPRNLFLYCLTFNNAAIYRCRFRNCGALIDESELNTESPRLHWECHKTMVDRMMKPVRGKKR